MTTSTVVDLDRQLDIARWLVEVRGHAVFAVDHPALPSCIGAHPAALACTTRGKHPAVAHWSRQSTRDLHDIARLFRAGPRNIGVDAGRSGLLIVDEDAPGELDRAAAAVGASVPPTFAVRTAKGRHLYFRQPEDSAPYGNGTGALRGYRIDVRGQGGYVVAPGSMHASGHEYRPVDPYLDVLPVPTWLAQLLRPPLPAPSTPRAPVGSAAEHRGIVGVVQVVLSAREGGRNCALHWAACRLSDRVRDGRLDRDTAAAILLDAGRVVGLPDAEIRATIASAQRMVLGG